MSKRPEPRPTEAELAILRELWSEGALSIREIHDRIKETRGTSYTTTLKIAQIMFEKGLVDRDESQRVHIYRALIGEKQTQQTLVNDLIERAFAGSAAALVMRALSTRTASKEELAEIRALIDAAETKKGGSKR